MYPLDFLALPLGALSRPLSIHPISLCRPVSIFRDSRGSRGGFTTLYGIPRYEIGHRYGPRWIARETWNAWRVVEWARIGFIKLNSRYFGLFSTASHHCVNFQSCLNICILQLSSAEHYWSLDLLIFRYIWPPKNHLEIYIISVLYYFTL